MKHYLKLFSLFALVIAFSSGCTSMHGKDEKKVITSEDDRANNQKQRHTASKDDDFFDIRPKDTFRGYEYDHSGISRKCDSRDEERFTRRMQQNNRGGYYLYRCLSRVYGTLELYGSDPYNVYKPGSIRSGFAGLRIDAALSHIYQEYYQEIREGCLTPLEHAISILEDSKKHPDNSDHQDLITWKIRLIQNVIDRVKVWREEHPQIHNSVRLND